VPRPDPPKAARPQFVLPPTAEQVLRSSAFAAPQRTYPTGIIGLDALIDGGAKARQLTTIIGPPGAGKTSLDIQIARALARQLPVLYASTELELAECAARPAAQELGLRPGSILALEHDMSWIADSVMELPLYLVEVDPSVDTAGLATIRAAAEAIRTAAGTAPAVFVDYMQMIADDDATERRLSVSRVASQLRRLSRDLDAPVFGVSSTARPNYANGRKATDGEEDPRMWLAAAKESGDVEYASAVVAYLEVDGQVGPTGESHARLIVAKSRRGRTGFVGLRFHGPSGRFYEDAGAVEAMGPARKRQDEESRVLAALRQAGHALVKDDLRGRCSIQARAAGAAIDRLVADERIVARKVKRPNATGAMRPVEVLALPDWPGEVS
jgi:replicative DNA helicase